MYDIHQISLFIYIDEQIYVLYIADETFDE